jgi:hypothetical protein
MNSYTSYEAIEPEIDLLVLSIGAVRQRITGT